MYVMASTPIPVSIKRSAFVNESGSNSRLPAYIVGFGYTPDQPLELVIEQGGHRFYEIPLRFTGERAGAQYAIPTTKRLPIYTQELKPRYAVLFRLPWADAATGTVYGFLTWADSNLTLLVVVMTTGEVVLWPPHKMQFGIHCHTPLPHWLKRRYDNDRPPLELTRVTEAYEEDVYLRLNIAKKALRLHPTNWRSHGIGLIQCYMPGPEGEKQYRVHVWTPDAMRIGLESGIHNHRYDLKSWIVAGQLTQEEWTVTPSPKGMWQMWEHRNDDSMIPTLLEGRFDATPRTLDLYAGQVYSFPSQGFHRSVPRSDVVVTVMERSNLRGLSNALAPCGHTPINGQTVELPVEEYMALARKHLGVSDI